MKITLSIAKLASLIEVYKNIKLENNREISITDLGLTIAVPGGSTTINEFIKKENLPLLTVTLSNGYTFKAATRHIVRSSGIDTYLEDLKVGDKVDHRSMVDIRVSSIEKSSFGNCFDISVDSPHIYYDANGVKHHNTITTATLAKICEKYGQTITIVPNKSLVEQTEEDFVNVGLDVGVYYGDRKDLNKTHTICTWQSLNIWDKKSKNDDDILQISEFLSDVRTVMVDECFASDSRVLTPSGHVAIKDIKAGDKIINYSESTKEFKIDIVVKQHVNLTNSASEKMYEMEFDNGSKIQVTGNHKFLTNFGWIRADELTEKHEIVFSNINSDDQIKGIYQKDSILDDR